MIAPGERVLVDDHGERRWMRAVRYVPANNAVHYDRVLVVWPGRERPVPVPAFLVEGVQGALC